MKTLITLLLACCFGSAMAQSNLAACQGEVRTWTNCFGYTTSVGNGGYKYVGEWKDGKQHGQGTYSFDRRGNYADEFKDGKRNPQVNFISGYKYVGEFKDNLKNGQGIYTFPDGEKYVGEFKDDQRTGQGIEFNVDGSIKRSGIYEAGNFVRSQVIDPFSFARITLEPSDNRPRWSGGQLMRPDATETTSITAESSDNRPRWSGGQLMTPDPAEAASMAKVPTQPDFKPLTELERLREEAEFAKRYQAELKAELLAAQEVQVKPTAPIGPRLRVHAMVIGNGAYQGSGRLDNPINDARAMSAKLRQMGFKVTTVENATRSKLVRALVGFNRSASATDVSMFFYAGHAAQISGINYMLPTDINMNDLSEVPLHGISLNSVIDQYLPGKTKLVFLDACRDNPLLQVASRSVSRGLAPISVSEGVMIAYATKDGSVAADGNGKNSPFTKALLQHIDGPDDISVVLRKVRAEVMQDTDGKQQPWDYNSLTGGSLILSAIRAK